MTNPSSDERLSGLIEHYMQTRGDGRSPLSMARASREIKTVMSDCPASGPDLQNLIAEAAIKHGYAVHFDMGSPVDEIPAFHV